ncbi:Uncharacterised protein [Burkholderia pseudomallei]|nr:Uncharacterised protein [Burkholderia pseudomallei]CAJ3291883.1 Uncharacterised protein [Burkholderia pseudomallei]CAJ3493853.1 Uncharacterised protein [Burkholderia pseudomallei]CAJ3675450.1 Uncharacterised protein [Burkholderia pseudomallei]CAJ4189631.1 Uncharacterised protein [Burkholderia pseudomallei]
MNVSVYVESLRLALQSVMPIPPDAYTPYIGPAFARKVNVTLGNVVVKGFPASLYARRSVPVTDCPDMACTI